MRPLLAEINTTPGDFGGNCSQIREKISEAVCGEYDAVIFPELTICGYLVRDLLYLDGFIEANLKCLAEICAFSAITDLTVIVGYADRSHKEYGKPFKNMAAVIRNGVVIATYQKQLLPFYDVFDEPRYFEPGTDLCKIKIADEVCGITICEDLWNDKGQDDYRYNNNPVERYLKNGVETIINLSSSPWYQGKTEKRIEMAKKITERCKLIYVNQIGGQDELVFDGNSMIAQHTCSGWRITYNSMIAQHTYSGWRMTHKNQPENGIITFKNQLKNGIEELVHNLVLGLKDYVHKTGHTEVVVNSSGGVDSAVVIALATMAFGSDKVHCIMMPSKYSSKGSVLDAKKLHAQLGCNEHTIAIDHDPILFIVKNGFKINKVPHPVAEENIQARMRGMMGAIYFSNAYGALPLTTGNKTELALGYCTLYGDMSGGFNPIGDLYKDEVYAIGEYLGIPEEIMNKAPSAELAPGQTDEASLLPYKYLNSIVKAFIEEHISSYANWIAYSGFKEVSEMDYDKMIRKIKNNEFKRRQAAPCIKVSKIAFGMGRRMPIVGKY